jgi:hypothetical protein
VVHGRIIPVDVRLRDGLRILSAVEARSTSVYFTLVKAPHRQLIQGKKKHLGKMLLETPWARHFTFDITLAVWEHDEGAHLPCLSNRYRTSGA